MGINHCTLHTHTNVQTSRAMCLRVSCYCNKAALRLLCIHTNSGAISTMLVDLGCDLAFELGCKPRCNYSFRSAALH